MQYKLPKKTIKATKCDRDYACLSGRKGAVCVVEHAVGDGEIIMVKRTNKCSDRYYKPFADGGCCECPVRKEIYKRYKC